MPLHIVALGTGPFRYGNYGRYSLNYYSGSGVVQVLHREVLLPRLYMGRTLHFLAYLSETTLNALLVEPSNFPFQIRLATLHMASISGQETA